MSVGWLVSEFAWQVCCLVSIIKLHRFIPCHFGSETMKIKIYCAISTKYQHSLHLYFRRISKILLNGNQIRRIDPQVTRSDELIHRYQNKTANHLFILFVDYGK